MPEMIHLDLGDLAKIFNVLKMNLFRIIYVYLALRVQVVKEGLLVVVIQYVLLSFVQKMNIH
jgi:hypothetical protein